MIIPNSQDYFVIYHVDDSDGYWFNIAKEDIQKEFSDDCFADNIVEKILKIHYPEAKYFDVYFRNSEDKEFFKKYQKYEIEEN